MRNQNKFGILTRKHSKGQALVEMAIILPLLMLLVIGIFEFGRAMYTKNTLTHAARAGARAAVVTPGITVDSDNANNDCTYGTDPNDIVYKTTCSSLYSGTRNDNSVINISFTDLTNNGTSTISSGDMVTVSVTFNNFEPVVPFIPLPDTLIGTTSMRYE